MLLKIPITQSTMTSNKARYSATRRRAIQHGYRSGFEEAPVSRSQTLGCLCFLRLIRSSLSGHRATLSTRQILNYRNLVAFTMSKPKGSGVFPIDPKRVYCTSNTPIWIYGMCFRTGIPRSTKEAQRHTRCLLRSRASHLLTKKYHKSG